jgi:hypothetical protein
MCVLIFCTAFVWNISNSKHNSDGSARLSLYGFRWNLILKLFKKIVLLKSDENNEWFAWRRFHIYDNITEFLERQSF